VYFFGAFEELRNAIISFVMPAALSVRMEEIGFRWKDLYEI
jgi:hypothetical protein